ncbi:MAG: SAM-dependent methyltransferase [Clostridia bacterium]|nr:SAM-dependent methyltransferase [Clostridia bacterium]
MNKKSVDKAMLFFSGLWSRMKENSDYFENIKITLRSGTREYFARFTYERGEIYRDYLGERKKCSDYNSLPEILREYDSALISYNERGTEILIEADDKNVRMKNREKQTEPARLSTVKSGREYLLSPGKAAPLLRELGILAENGKIKNDKVRKYNQIDYFLELADGILKDVTPDRELLVLDCACGKSYLSFAMNCYFTEVKRRKCRFIGVDVSPEVIKASERTAKNLNYKNMTFVCSDLAEYMPHTPPDLVISLHACDTLTDMALAFGIRSRASAVMSVPCCHKDILKQYSYEPFSMVTKHGILKARLADTLTDALRAAYLEASGYEVSLIEYISPLETPKNIMIRAVYTGKRSEEAAQNYKALKEMIHVSPAIEKFGKKIQERGL